MGKTKLVLNPDVQRVGQVPDLLSVGICADLRPYPRIQQDPPAPHQFPALLVLSASSASSAVILLQEVRMRIWLNAEC